MAYRDGARRRCTAGCTVWGDRAARGETSRGERIGSVAEPIDPDDLAVCLRVLDQAAALDADHPDSVRVQHAVGHMFKKLKRRRRHTAREQIAAADRAVIAATATGAPDRIDDETAGVPLRSRARGASAGTLLRPWHCYICKLDYTQVDAFYHQLCPDCAAKNHAKRDARTDLRGRRALLTGGRAKIGMYIALRLLRDGAHTTITTRFPHDAVRRFAAMPDASDWLHRLRVVGIDLRDPAQVVALADDVAAAGRARHRDQQRRADGAPLPRRVFGAGGGRVGSAADRRRRRPGQLRQTRRGTPRDA